jgi:uncharacterized protein (DUF2141 family)
VKQVFKFLFLAGIFIALTHCARTGRPEGGAKDEMAPLLVTSEPPYESINFDSDNIRIYFDEYITLKDLNKQLVVSPPLKNPSLITPQSAPSKYINIKIADTLLKNTTYIFNFGNAIQDNNEGNKLEIFKYVFSTGSYIDSLLLKGNIKDAYLKETEKSINVLLYKIDSSYTDSIIFKEKPNYVTNTLDTTNFNFSNLEKGNYFLVALKETANDYLFNPKTDKIGFSLDTIVLPRDSIINKSIAIFNENLPYNFKRGKEVTKGKIQFGFEGGVNNLKVKILSETPEDFKSISKYEVDKDTLNYWFTPFQTDSLNLIISSGKDIDTTTVFLRKKKIDSLILSTSISQTLNFKDTFYLESNNPIIQIDTSKISLIDKDTLAVNFSSFLSSKENKIAVIFDTKPKQKYTLKILPEAFSDIFSQKNDTLSYRFGTKGLDDYGRITLNIINSESKNLIIELIDTKEKVIETKFLNTSKKVVFDLLEPKKYTVRAIIDTNKNNTWDTGNFLKRQLPEKIIYYNEELKVRANHFIENTFKVMR